MKDFKFNGTVYAGYVYINNVKTPASEVIEELKEWFLQRTLFFVKDSVPSHIDIESSDAYKKYASWIKVNGTIEYMFSNPNQPSFDGAKIAQLIKQAI
jgi:hypothetical protein